MIALTDVNEEARKAAPILTLCECSTPPSYFGCT